MLQPYWDYYVEKNWNYNLYPEILHSNIFCYGKPNSGKTRKIAIPIAESAIKEGRSCIIYAEKANEEYAPIIELAKKNGYEITRENAAELDDDDSQIAAESITNDIFFEEKNLIIISNTDFKKSYQHTIVNYIIENISQLEKEGEPGISKDRSQSTLVILDGLCGNMVIDEDALKQIDIQFCIIMGSQIAYIPGLYNELDNFIIKDYYPFDATKEIEELLKVIILHKFFSNFETIICTGVNGVKPEMHREFIGKHIFDMPSARLGGKFIIMEYPPEGRAEGKQLHTRGTPKKVDIDQETIESSTYNEIAEERIKQNRWILEQNGKLALYFDDEIYTPITFKTKTDALDWVASIARKNNMKITHMEQDSNMASLVIQNENNKKEYFLTYINEQDVESFRFSYFLRVLEMGEYDDIVTWLQTEEAISQGYDPEIPIEENVQKYYENLKKAAEAEAEKEASLAEESNKLPPLLPIEPYWEKYQADKDLQQEINAFEQNEHCELPKEKVLFLGGHINMVKRIKQLHPKWLYITDDDLKSTAAINVKYVFYWTKHASHMMMENIFNRLAPDAEIIYVTATNMDRLENEMLTKYIENKNRRRRVNLK